MSERLLALAAHDLVRTAAVLPSGASGVGGAARVTATRHACARAEVLAACSGCCVAQTECLRVTFSVASENAGHGELCLYFWGRSTGGGGSRGTGDNSRRQLQEEESSGRRQPRTESLAKSAALHFLQV